MTVIEVLLVAISIALVIGSIQLKQRIKALEDQAASRPPETVALTPKDLQQLQNSLADLVAEIEQYSESQLRRMKTQSEAIRLLCEQIELKIKAVEIERLPVEIPVEKPTHSRLIPLTPKPVITNHKDHDRIIELHKRGWKDDQIAKELRITRGEVQLIVNLA